MQIRNITIGLLLILLSVACNKDDSSDEPQQPEADARTQKVTSFIHSVMESQYLWYAQIPKLDLKYETDPEDYFFKILAEEDKFSHITDNLEELLGSLEGNEKTYGYSLSFAWIDETETQLAAFVDYTYPGSPAEKAGLKRGDMILAANSTGITPGNRFNLISSNSVSILYCHITPEGKPESPLTAELQAINMNLDPVHTSKVLEAGGKKIGYLFYTSFISNFNSSLDRVFSEFKAAGITELIVDLRYNGGGDDNALVNLCSHIVPSAYARNREVLLIDEANDKQLVRTQTTRFTDTLLTGNSELQRVFVLTSGNTYSASEATIIGLNPYMTVVRIGERTGGKYTSMSLFVPTAIVNGKKILDPEIGNWALLPITSQYTNGRGESCKGGLAPNHKANPYTLPMAALGDPADPLLGKALELIGGTPAVTSARTRSAVTVRTIGRGTSGYDEIKNNLIHK